MNKIISLLILKDEFEFKGSFKELNKRIQLDNNKRFNVEWISKNKLKFLSKFSIGTLMMTGLNQYIDGIKGYAELTELDSNRTKVELKTKIRVELYILAVFITIAYFVFSASEVFFFDLKPWYLPILLLWFWFIYRVQEYFLFHIFKKHLKEK